MRFNKQFRSSVLLVLVLVLMTSAVIFAASKDELTYGEMAGDLKLLDPALPFVSNEATILTTVMESLVDYPLGEVSTNFTPGLAEKWNISNGGKKYTFYLRKNVSWHHNYGEFTADDVVFSLNRYRDPKESVWAGQYADITDVKKIDKYTVEVTLNKPDPFFLGRVATNTESGSLMMCKKAFEDNGSDKMRLFPVGTGPFVFNEYKSKEYVSLVRNESYWGVKANLKKITYLFMPNESSRELALLSGNIDTMRIKSDPVVFERLRAKKFTIDTQGPEILWWFICNTKVKPFDDLRVRQAIAYAINRNDFSGIFGKEVTSPLNTIFTPSYFGALTDKELAPSAKYSQNIKKAKELLADAGYPKGFNVEMLITERSDYQTMMLIIQQQLKQIGINVKLNLVEHTTYHSEIRKSKNPLILYGELRYPEAGIILRRFLHSSACVSKSTAVRNFANYENAQLDAYLEEAEKTYDLKRRGELYKKVQEIAMRDLPMIPVIATKQALIRSPKVDLGYKLKTSLVLGYRFLSPTKKK